MTQSDTFIHHLEDSLSLVDNDYYGLRWLGESDLEILIPPNTPGREDIIEYLDRYGERVFCYELYHQLRIKMDSSSESRKQFANVKLQGELRKTTIGEMVQDFHKVNALSREYIPDFLLHSPGNFTEQLIVMEVKSKPDLCFKDMQHDLEKIQEFIREYRYEKGVFLAVNADIERVREILYSSDFIHWVEKEISTPERIHIIAQQNRHTRCFNITLDEVLG